MSKIAVDFVIKFHIGPAVLKVIDPDQFGAIPTISDKTLWTKYKNKVQVQCIRPPHPPFNIYAQNISTFRFKHQV